MPAADGGTPVFVAAPPLVDEDVQIRAIGLQLDMALQDERGAVDPRGCNQSSTKLAQPGDWVSPLSSCRTTVRQTSSIEDEGTDRVVAHFKE